MNPTQASVAVVVASAAVVYISLEVIKNNYILVAGFVGVAILQPPLPLVIGGGLAGLAMAWESSSGWRNNNYS